MNTYFLCMTQPTNVGDLVINKMMINELSKYGRVFVDCHNAPENFKGELLSNNNNLVDVFREYGISLKKLDLLRFYRLIKKENVDLFVTSPGPIGGGRGSNKLRSYALKLIYKTIKYAGIKHYSIGNCCSGAIRLHQKIHNPYIDKYFMRSNASVNYLLQQGNDASYIPDLAYLLNTERLSNERNKLAMLTFRAPKNMDAFMLWYDKLVSSLTSNGYNILLYYQVKADYDFIKRLYDRQHNDNISFKEVLLWYDEFSLYNNADLVISNRLHGLLVGAAYGALPLAVLTQGSDVAKIKDVFDSSFMNQQNYFTTELDNCDKLIYMLQNTDYLRKLLNNIESDNKIKCQSVFSEIAATFI